MSAGSAPAAERGGSALQRGGHEGLTEAGLVSSPKCHIEFSASAIAEEECAPPVSSSFCEGLSFALTNRTGQK